MQRAKNQSIVQNSRSNLSRVSSFFATHVTSNPPNTVSAKSNDELTQEGPVAALHSGKKKASNEAFLTSYRKIKAPSAVTLGKNEETDKRLSAQNRG